MTRREQIALLRGFTKNVADHLISRADRWPAEWDGHELRELAATAFNNERTSLMREDRRRRRACKNAMIVNGLY